MEIDQTNQYPSPSQAIRLLLLALVLQITVALLMEVAGLITHFSARKHPEAIAVTNLVALGLPLIWGLRKTKAAPAEVFPFSPVRSSLLFPMLLTIMGTNVLLSDLGNLVHAGFPEPRWSAELFSPFWGTRKGFWGGIALLVLIAPLTEELLFRGLILRGFLSRYAVRKAVLVSAALFALFHLNPWQLLGAFCLGALLGWWFVRTRSLLPCILGHALNNAMPLVLGPVLQLKIPGYTATRTRQIEFQPPWVDLLGLLVAVAGVWLLNRMFRKPDHMPRASA